MSNSNPARGYVTLKPSRKRKELEGGFDAVTVNKSTPLNTTKDDDPAADNRLLAGYLAHEFLTQGTLFGQKYDPARAEAVPLPARNTRGGKGAEKRVAAAAAVTPSANPQVYADVCNLLKTGRVHIPGIVNPTQLARWLQM